MLHRGQMISSGMTATDRIRNFSIIAHIDHGKSTLSDRLIELCGNVTMREMKEQILDSMEIERERGITIKAQTVRLDYKAKDGNVYQLNLMDTPGHVDFAYEVSRSLAACEGAVLVVDASQGVEAQTLANVYQAIDNSLEILPVLNKVDLPAADPDRVKQQIEDVIGIDASCAIPISAKTGENVAAVLEAIVTRLPPPKGRADEPLRALLIDSWYDAYLGVIVLVRVFDGRLKKGQRIKLMSSSAIYQIERVGIFRPKQEMISELGPGEVGFFTAAIKQVADTRVGDTVTDEKRPCAKPLPGFKPVQPVVFCGLFPVDAGDFEDLREALAKLRLNDASFTYEAESSTALGFGFRCGFLGLLHLEIIIERLEREFDLDLITTAPSVIYHLHLIDGAVMEMHNPSDMPDPVRIDHIEEPWIEATILVPDEYLGAVLKLCQDRRGRQKQLTYAGSRAMLVYHLPLNEVVFDFYDRLKSVSRGYASFDYQLAGLRGRRSRQALDPCQQRAGRRAVDHRAQDARGKPRPGDVREAERPDPAAPLPDTDPGGDRRQGDRARDDPGAQEGRARQVLRRRHHAESASCSRSRRRARRRCGNSVRSRSHRKRSSPRSRWTRTKPRGFQFAHEPFCARVTPLQPRQNHLAPTVCA